MEKSSRFDDVKLWYDTKSWNMTRIRNAVKMNWITEDEFKTITGTTY